MMETKMTNEYAEAFAALVAAQGEMDNAVLNRVNPHFKSKYADLTAVREATLSALTKNGLGILQKPTFKDGRLVLISRLVHKSGVVVDECEYPLSTGGKPQQIGSEITYARRYTWAALCGISSDEDDDANAAETAPRREADKSAPQDPPQYQRSQDSAPHVQKVNGRYEGLTGPFKTKTELKTGMHDFVRHLMGVTNEEELQSLLDEYAALLDQIADDFPDWWDNDGDQTGLKQQIEQVRRTAFFGRETYAIGIAKEIDDRKFAEALAKVINSAPDLPSIKKVLDDNQPRLNSIPRSLFDLVMTANNSRTSILSQAPEGKAA